MEWIKEIKFDEKGLVPVVTQDYISGEVLMLAYANEESLQKTVETGKMNYYSRSRKKLWLKGETSGNFQEVKELRYDCDKDAILAKVMQTGPACHTGNKSCFYTKTDGTKAADTAFENVLLELYNTVLDRRDNPIEDSYTNYLLDKGIDKILKKVGEENAEVIIASKNNDKEEITNETADLMYHLSVMLVNRGVKWEDIFEELKRRRH